MLWKTRGTVRREAQGLKKIEEHLEFYITHDPKNAFGIVHTNKECPEIQEDCFLRPITYWEDQERPESLSVKIGRGAWVNVKTENECPHCKEKKRESETILKQDSLPPTQARSVHQKNANTNIDPHTWDSD